MSNPLFINVDLNEVVLKVCARCGYNGGKTPIDRHHVTYHPEKTVLLCRLCHIGITVINGTWGQRNGINLSNTTRRKLFSRFMACSWRMDQEKKPLVELKRRRFMVYKNRLRVLQVMFFKGGK